MLHLLVLELVVDLVNKEEGDCDTEMFSTPGHGAATSSGVR